ncbi:XRE family transcriptional regulator [Chromobacterium haemolyticum]|uniref:XRE family transcriptional regulator n=1 Tax=Chromobacterium fluminis TaxID=3044269 RepID=A0ABX0LDE1_9NEIS|nr:helix-turn-helix domain-containing protein [Chromobacterium haemolyticum]NHR07436.1 XRE family transcriptional regulator [Chromobacterium haemolyticum]
MTTENIGQQLGPRLREERRRLGIKVKDMTASLGLSRNMWHRYEMGAVPGLSILIACSELGFDIAYLLTGHRTPVFLTSTEALLLARFRTASVDRRDFALETLA